MTSKHTFMVSDWNALPDKYRHDCMEQIAPGVYRHHRLDTTFVIAGQIRSQEMDARHRVLTDLMTAARRPGETFVKTLADMAVSANPDRLIGAIKQYRADYEMVYGYLPNLSDAKRACEDARDRMARW